MEKFEKPSEGGIIEKGHKWLKDNAKVIVLGAALFGVGGGVGAYTEKESIENSDETIKELVRKSENLSKVNVIGEVVDRQPNGYTYISGAIQGQEKGYTLEFTAVLDEEGKLRSIKVTDYAGGVGSMGQIDINKTDRGGFHATETTKHRGKYTREEHKDL